MWHSVSGSVGDQQMAGKHHWPWLVWPGVFIGLGGLTHPFALAYAIQIGVWVL
jgi:hypothetical protein